MSSHPALEVRGVSKRFGHSEEAVQALQDISISVPKGQFLMLAGPSGCGKSTLLAILAGLERPDEGTVLIDGQPVTGPGPDRSLVFQDGALFPWLNVQQNVEFGLKQAGLAPKERADKATAFLDRVGLANFRQHSIHQLSGGMRQRVAIARSLVLDPKVLLMDEPFSALDALTREDLYGEMQTIWQDRDTTVVFVTHNVREAVTLGDRVILMSPRPGRIQLDTDVDILRPRHIDDVDVAIRAQKISHAMKQGPHHPRHDPNLENLRPRRVLSGDLDPLGGDRGS